MSSNSVLKKYHQKKSLAFPFVSSVILGIDDWTRLESPVARCSKPFWIKMSSDYYLNANKKLIVKKYYLGCNLSYVCL